MNVGVDMNSSNLQVKDFKRVGPKNHSTMDFSPTRNGDVTYDPKLTKEGQSVEKKDAHGIELERGLESLVLRDNGAVTENEVEEMTCIPVQSLDDRTSRAVLLTSSSLSQSGNCIMCRLGCQHESNQDTNEPYGKSYTNQFDKPNSFQEDILTNIKTTRHHEDNNEKQEQANINPYFLVKKETSSQAASGGGDIDDEGCFLSSLTPTNTSSKSQYKNCTVNIITSSNSYTNVKINDNNENDSMTNDSIINVGGDDRNSSSTSNPNNNIINTATSRSSFSERCSSSDVDSGRVSDTDTGTTSSTNSSNHIGEDLNQSPERFIQSSKKNQRREMMPNDEHMESEKEMVLNHHLDDNHSPDSSLSHTQRSRSPQMVHIVSHSYCDFLGTLPGAESRCNKTKTSQSSVEKIQNYISDNTVSDNFNGNISINTTQPSEIHIPRSTIEIENEDAFRIENDLDEPTLLDPGYQQSQNKVTVFVPYSTIIRCMNETMDRKRKSKKKAQTNCISNEQPSQNSYGAASSYAEELRNSDYQNDISLHSSGSASCLGIVVGGEDSEKDVTQNVPLSDQLGRNHPSDNNNKLYSKRMTKRLQHYNREGGIEGKSSFGNDSEESQGVKPCMLMLTEDSEELILPTPPPFPTSTTTQKVTNYDEIIRNELLKDSEEFLEQIRQNRFTEGQNREEGDVRKRSAGIPRRKDLCKLLGLNERNVGDLLIVPDEKVKVAQKVALMHKCNIAPIPVKQSAQSQSIRHNQCKDQSAINSSHLSSNHKYPQSNSSTETVGNGKSIAPPEQNPGIDHLDAQVIDDSNKSSSVINHVSIENSVVIPQRKKSKNLAKFFGVDEESASNPLQADPKTVNGKEVSSEKESNPNDINGLPIEGNSNIVLRRKKNKERSSSSELRMGKIDETDYGLQHSMHMNRNQEHGGRPKSLLVSWNNLLKRSSVRWRNGNNLMKGPGHRAGVLAGIQKASENYSSGDESEDYSSSDDEILQELQVPVQFRQMHGPLYHNKENGLGSTLDSIDGHNPGNGTTAGVPKRKDLSKFLGLDDSDSEEIVFIQNNKVPRQKAASNNDTFSSFESFSKHSHNSSICNNVSHGATAISSHSSQTEVDSSSGNIVEPISGCNNEIDSSSSPTNTASTSNTYHPTCHLPLRNPILDMLENDMDNFEPPTRKSVVFKDYGLFSVEESIAQGLPIIPFDSVNLAEGKQFEKKKGQSGIGVKKRKKDAQRRASEIFLDDDPDSYILQKNCRARSSSSESSLQVLFRNSRSTDAYNDPPSLFNDRQYYHKEDKCNYRVIRGGSSDNLIDVDKRAGHLPFQLRNGKTPRRNVTCKELDKDKSPGGNDNENLENGESNSNANENRAGQLPVRSALRSPNSPPKRPCGPVVFGANSRRTISPIRKTSNKPGVTLAYLPPVAQPMVPAVYYHNHRFPVILYGHHHPNVGYISHVDQSNSNFCRAFTRGSPSRVNPGPAQDRSITITNGGIRNNPPRANTKPGMIQDSKVNGRPAHANRPVSGHFISTKPPRQRQMVNQDNDRAGPPVELHKTPDSNGTYVVMRNSTPKKPSTILNI